MQIGNPSLLVINTQVDLCSPVGFAAKLGRDINSITIMLPKLKNFIKKVRNTDVPIVYCQYVARKDLSPQNIKINKDREEKARMCLLNSRGSNFYKCQPLENDLVVKHNYYDAFAGSSLNMHLKKMRTKTLIITGVRSELSVDMTAKRGISEGYEVIVVSDLIATYRQNSIAEKQFLKIFDRYYGNVLPSDKVYSNLE